MPRYNVSVSILTRAKARHWLLRWTVDYGLVLVLVSLGSPYRVVLGALR